MAYPRTMVGEPEMPRPAIHKITMADLRDVLAKGIDDFLAMPSHAIFLTAIYPIVGIILLRLTLGYRVMPLIYPIVAGFALVGPFAALGLYELSRRREQGLDVSASDVLEIFRSPALGAILKLGVGLMIIFLVWVAIAHSLYIANFGYGAPASLASFLSDLFTTRAGWNLIIVGNLVGLCFAALVLIISVVSFPLLLEHDVSATEAVLTSVRAVLANPVPMAAWGLIVLGSLAIGMLPLFFGLPVVLPVLGHATWHLYRKVVAY